MIRNDGCADLRRYFADAAATARDTVDVKIKALDHCLLHPDSKCCYRNTIKPHRITMAEVIEVSARASMSMIGRRD